MTPLPPPPPPPPPPDKEATGGKRSTLERSRSKVRTVYYNISGQVIEADGLKGELGEPLSVLGLRASVEEGCGDFLSLYAMFLCCTFKFYYTLLYSLHSHFFTPSHHHTLSPHTLTPHPLTPSLPHTLTRQLGALHQTPSEHASQLPTATEVWAGPGCAQDEGPPRLAQPAVEGGLHGTVLSGFIFNSHCCTPL